VGNCDFVGRRAHQEVLETKSRQADVLRKKQGEFRAGITKQIHEKQEERINERRARYQEGVQLEELAKARRQRLEEAKIRKLNELRYISYSLTHLWVTWNSGAPGQKCKDSPPRAPSPFHSLLTSPLLCNFVPGTGTRGPLHSGAPWTLPTLPTPLQRC